MLTGVLSPRSVVLPLLVALVAVGCGTAAVTAPAPGTGAGPAAPKVNKVVLLLNNPPNETMTDVRRLCCFDMVMLRPLYENLMGVDSVNGKYIPQLATEWKLEPGNTGVRFKLQKGVQFNNGYGELTAKDVQFSWQDTIKDQLNRTPNTFAPWWARTFKSIDIVNDYEVVFQFTQPDSTFFDLVSESAGNLPVRPKAEFDKEGELGDNRPKFQTGSGAYVQKDRTIGSFIRFEKRPDKHWRMNPEFPEMELRWAKEPSVRLAALLAGEAHITILPDDLMPQAERSGMKVVRGKVPGTRSWGTWSCCNRTETGEYYRDNTSPLLNVKVRQALNKAIDRDALQKAFFTKGERMYINHMHQTWPGWDTTWERRWNDLYGYEPAKARLLLTEAGYGPSNPLRINVAIRQSTVISNAPDVVEAIAGFWRAVGVESPVIQTDTATQQAEIRSFKWTNHFYIDASSTVQVFAWPNRNSDLFNYPRNGTSAYFDKDSNTLNEKLMREMNEGKQGEIMRDLGEVMYSRFGSVPLFFMPVEVLVNPQFVADWVFTGPLWGTWTHLENIKATR